jgi:hypothetical protein
MNRAASRSVVVALAVACALAAFAGPAQAKKKNFGTQLAAAASSKNRVFTGNVISKAPCRGNRRISVFGSGFLQGTARSRRDGRWRVRIARGRASIPPGTYFAAVKKRVSSRRGDKIVCRAASVTFDVVALP